MKASNQNPKCATAELYIKEVGQLDRLNFRLKGYFSRRYLWTVSFHTKKLCINFVTDYSIEVAFYLKPRKNRFLSHSLGDLWETYALHLQLVGKPVIDFLFAIIELFSGISYG